MVTEFGGHMYRHPVGHGRRTGHCVYGCGCWNEKGTDNFGGPDGVDPRGTCPRAPAGTRFEQLLAQPSAHL